MDRKGRDQDKENIPGSGRSMQGYILTYSGIYRENIKCCHLWVLKRVGVLSKAGESNQSLFYFMSVHIEVILNTKKQNKTMHIILY